MPRIIFIKIRVTCLQHVDLDLPKVKNTALYLKAPPLKPQSLDPSYNRLDLGATDANPPGLHPNLERG